MSNLNRYKAVGFNDLSEIFFEKKQHKYIPLLLYLKHIHITIHNRK